MNTFKHREQFKVGDKIRLRYKDGGSGVEITIWDIVKCSSTQACVECMSKNRAYVDKAGAKHCGGHKTRNWIWEKVS